MNFLGSLLTSLLANLITYIFPITYAWVLFRPLLRFWHIGPFLGSRYLIVISTREDDRKHFLAPDSERCAATDLRDFFQVWLVKILCRTETPECWLSQNVKRDKFKGKNLILLGGPCFNSVVKEMLGRLNDYGLQYTFEEVNGRWIIRDKASSRIYDSSYIESEPTEEGEHYDHAILVRAPNPSDNNLAVFIFAGIHGAGTRAAVAITRKRYLCQRLYERMKHEQLKSQFFAAVVRVNVREAVTDSPQIMMVSTLNTHAIPAVASPSISSQQPEIKAIQDNEPGDE